MIKGKDVLSFVLDTIWRKINIEIVGEFRLKMSKTRRKNVEDFTLKMSIFD